MTPLRRSMLQRAALLAIAAGTGLYGCAALDAGQGWQTLLDGERGLEHWSPIGDANWHAQDGAIVADQGKGGFLVSRQSYGDFHIRAEFWAAADTNSGIFVRAADPAKVGAANAYEVNIWDIRPDPSYGTGAIVNVAKVPVPNIFQAGGRWNTMEVIARGTQLRVLLNGVETVRTDAATRLSGPFALQYALGVDGARGGPIKWRKVQIRPI